MLTAVKSLWRRLTTPLNGQARFRLDPFESLSPQPDRELDVLLSRLPVEPDTLETHLALAELFRKRGEIDRAIRVHETLLAADLESDQQRRIQVQLAQDFFFAGLLGRAEEILEQLIIGQEEGHQRAYSAQSFRLWLTVLEREKEWYKAIELVRKYGQPGSGNVRLANLYCEHAKQLIGEDRIVEARSALKEARKQSRSARTFIVSSELETFLGNHHRALRLLKEALIRDVRRVDVVLPNLKSLSRLTGGEAALRRYLEELYDQHPSHRVLEALLDWVGPRDPKADHWQRELENIVNSGASFGLMQRWLNQREDIGDRAKAVLVESLQRLKLRLSDVYQCNHCGFESNTMLWNCPQCERWETVFSRQEHKTYQQLRQATPAHTDRP